MGRTLSDDWEESAARDRERLQERHSEMLFARYVEHQRKIDDLRRMTDDERRARGMYVPQKRPKRKRKTK